MSISDFVTEKYPIGASGNRLSPISSALFSLWSTQITVSVLQMLKKSPDGRNYLLDDHKPPDLGASPKDWSVNTCWHHPVGSPSTREVHASWSVLWEGSYLLAFKNKCFAELLWASLFPLPSPCSNLLLCTSCLVPQNRTALAFITTPCQ